MKIDFYKYHGTGNDFILIDNRENKIVDYNPAIISKVCNRHTGIGADGLMLLELHDEYNFRMVYFNSDGKQSSMCGNGGRCIVAFANHLQIIKNECTFEAIDGIHHAKVDGNTIHLQMIDVKNILTQNADYEIYTGSPHYVRFEENTPELNVNEEGKKIRNSEVYKIEGINVNFVKQLSSNEIFVRTFERGVENETLSCGTGVTACALANAIKNGSKGSINQKVNTPGGTLNVNFEFDNYQAKNVWLLGPAVFVFKGEIDFE